MRRGAIPPGKAGLVVLAAAAIPVVIGAAKPFARAIGRGLTKIGDKLQEAASEAKKSNGVKPEPPTEAKVAETVAKPAVVEEPPVVAPEPVIEPEPAPAPVVEAEVAKAPKKAKVKPAPKADKSPKKKAAAPKAARKRPVAPDDFETA